MKPGIVIVAIATTLPVLAQAQPVPETGMVAVGAAGGVYVPTDEQLEPTVTVGGHGEYYATPRVSVRVGLAWMDPEFDRGTNDSIRQLRLGFDALYNWERGVWHPFAGAGLGVHLLDLTENDQEIASKTVLGVSILGGLEYFARRRTTIVGEVRYDLVGDFRRVDPGGLGVTIGIKRYF